MIKVGDRLPEVTFTAATAEGPKPMTTADVFAGKKVILVAVPGAFTPTCTKNHLPGFIADPATAIGLFDLFALSSESEQFPISVVEAMATGLAVAAPAVGDVAAMLAPENAAYVTPPGDEGALADALLALAEDAPLRAAIGAANRRRARAEYDEKAMIAAYRAVYGGALGRGAFP